jgi:hypothetical protein
MDQELLTAVNQNDLSEVKRLIKKGCDVNTVDSH